MANNGGESNNPNPGGGQGDSSGEKMFTQAEVNEIVQKRLQQERKRLSADGLTDSERARVETEIEGLRTKVTSLTSELDAAKKTAKTEKDAADGVRRAYKTVLINRAIGDAAAKANAIDPSVVARLLEGDVRAKELTENGEPTGKYAVEVRTTKTVDGKEEVSWVAPEEGVKELLARSPFLVKSQTPPGAGTPPASQPPSGKPTELPKGIAKSELPGVGHLPTGGATGAGEPLSDIFAKAGSRLEERLRSS